MKKLLVVLGLFVLAGAGYHRVKANGPEATYEAFAEEILHQRYEAAAGMANGLTAKQLESEGSQERIGPGPAMFQTLFPSRFTIDSSESTPTGGVTLNATQTVLFNPVGVESAMRPAMYARLKQVVTLEKRKAGWRVTAFSNTFDSMGEPDKPR